MALPENFKNHEDSTYHMSYAQEEDEDTAVFTTSRKLRHEEENQTPLARPADLPKQENETPPPSETVKTDSTALPTPEGNPDSKVISEKSAEKNSATELRHEEENQIPPAPSETVKTDSTALPAPEGNPENKPVSEKSVEKNSVTETKEETQPESKKKEEEKETKNETKNETENTQEPKAETQKTPGTPENLQETKTPAPLPSGSPNNNGAPTTALSAEEQLAELPLAEKTVPALAAPPPADEKLAKEGTGRLTEMKMPELDGGPERMKTQDETILAQTESLLQTAALENKNLEEHKIAALGTNEKKKENASAKVTKTKSAVEETATEKKSEVNSKQVTAVSQIKSPEVKKESAENTLHASLSKVMPTTLEGVAEFKENKVATAVGENVEKTIDGKTNEIDGTFSQISKTEKPEDPKKGTPLGGIETPVNTAALNLGDHLVEPVSEEAVNLTAYKDESDNLLKREGISEQQLNEVTSGDLAEANKLRKDINEKTEKEPANIRKEEQTLHAKSKADLSKTEQEERAKMRKEREGGLRNSFEKQKGTKTALEKKKELVTNHINQIYETANTTVQTKLDGLKVRAMAQFEGFQTMASTTFENNVNTRIEAFKSKRYTDDLIGKGKWVKDLLFGIDEFPEVQEILTSERETYIGSIDKAIAFITANSQKTIDETKAILAKARQDIDVYMKGLAPDLQKIASDAYGDIKKKLEALDEKVNQAAEELKEALAEKRKAAIASIDKKIEAMREAMSGTLNKMGNLMADAALKFFEWAVRVAGYSMEDIMPFLNKGKMVLTSIVDDPGKFFENLGAGVGGGISNFVTNAGDHLKSGLFDWLTGAMGAIPIVFPEKWDAKGIFSFISQVLGFGWETIKTKLGIAAGIDAEKMSQVESAIAKGEEGLEGVKKVKEEGVSGAMEIVQDEVAAAKETAMAEVSQWAIMAIVKAAVPKILLMLNPAGAIAQIIAAIVKTVIWFKDNFARISKWANTVFDSVVDIAGGAIGVAAQKVEQSMAQAIPVILAFLAEQLGLGSVGKAIQNVLEKIRKPVDKIVDKVVNWIADKVRKIVKKVQKMFGKDKKADARANDPAANVPNPHDQQGPKDTEVGKDIGFTAGGETHHLWIDTKGAGARVMVASDVKTVPDQLDEWKAINDKKDNADPEKAKMNVVINEARTIHTATLSDANKSEQQMKEAEKLKTEKETQEATAMDNKVEQDQALLIGPMKKAFEAIEGGDNHIAQKLYKENESKVHSSARLVVKAGIDKIAESKIHGNTSKWETIVELLKETDKVKKLVDNPITNKMEYGRYTTKQVEDAANIILKDKEDDEKKSQIEQAIINIENKKETKILDLLIDQIFFNEKESEVNSKLQKLFSGEGSDGHTKFKPKIEKEVPNPSTGMTELVYTYEGGSEKFTLLYDTESRLPHKITGTNLGLHHLGRGVVKGETFDLHDRAHLIADMFRGSGYIEANNLIITSSHYNQILMKKEEEDIAIELANIKELVSFDMNVEVSWANVDNDAAVDEIKEAMQARLNYFKGRKKAEGPLIELERKTLESLINLPDSELITKINANIAAKKQPRCMKVNYHIFKHTTFDGVVHGNTDIKRRLGADMLYGIV